LFISQAATKTEHDIAMKKETNSSRQQGAYSTTNAKINAEGDRHDHDTCSQYFGAPSKTRKGNNK